MSPIDPTRQGDRRRAEWFGALASPFPSSSWPRAWYPTESGGAVREEKKGTTALLAPLIAEKGWGATPLERILVPPGGGVLDSEGTPYPERGGTARMYRPWVRGRFDGGRYEDPRGDRQAREAQRARRLRPGRRGLAAVTSNSYGETHTHPPGGERPCRGTIPLPRHEVAVASDRPGHAGSLEERRLGFPGRERR